MQPASTVKYGSTVYLKHCRTGAFLKSLPKFYFHPATSGQQMVVATLEKSEETRWMIKGRHVSGNYYPGEEVADGDIIRLEHCMTKRNLHSHDDHPSPISNQQEVTCYGENGVCDDNDDWIVAFDGPGRWKFDERIRLIHAKTGKALHSHNSGFNNFTNNEQEVTAYGERDNNDLWVVAASDQSPIVAQTKTNITVQPADHSEESSIAHKSNLAWPFNVLHEEGRKLKDVVWSFAICAVILIALTFLGTWWLKGTLDKGTIDALNGTIVEKDATIQKQKTIIDAHNLDQSPTDKAEADWKSSSVYQHQLMVKHDLMVICGQLKKKEDKLLRDPNDPVFIEDQQNGFFRFNVEKALDEAEGENLDMTAVTKLSLINLGGIKLSDRSKYYHDTRIECQKLADQLPKRMEP